MTVTINGSTGISGVDGSAATPALQGGDTNTGIVFGTDTVGVSTGGVQRTTVDSSGRLLVGVGSATANGGVLELSGGITFPATAVAASNANTLDDYEEGTWTPSLGGNTTYYNQTGTYTKIGNIVYIYGNLQVNTIGTGSATHIFGLPFTESGDASISFSFFDVNVSIYWANLYPSGTNLANRGQTAFDGVVNTGLSLYASGKQVVFSGVYKVN